MDPKQTSDAVCPLCGSARHASLGIRGNREYSGADPHATPHLWTNVLLCTACRFIYAHPKIPEAAALEAAYYDNPDTYKASFSGGHERMFQSRLSMIRRYVPSGRLLDVGAGKGEFLAEANKVGFRVDGVEPSPRFCAHAREAFGLELHVGSLGDVGAIQRKAYDVITLNHVLEHVSAPKEFLSTVQEYLKPNGVLFVEVPNADSNMTRVIDAYFRLRGRKWSSRLSPVHPPFHQYGYTERSLKYALDAAGYEILKIATFSGRERGVAASAVSLETRLRDLAFSVFDKVGNRELLCALARSPGLS